MNSDIDSIIDPNDPTIDNREDDKEDEPE